MSLIFSTQRICDVVEKEDRAKYQFCGAVGKAYEARFSVYNWDKAIQALDTTENQLKGTHVFNFTITHGPETYIVSGDLYKRTPE